MGSSDAMTHLAELFGKSHRLIEGQLLVYIVILTIFSVVEKMGLSEYGLELLGSYLFSSMVNTHSFFILKD